MPSGSHRTRGGSHRSGGARSSSSRSFNSSSSSTRNSNSLNRGPTFRMNFGTRVYVFGNKISLFIPFIFFALIAIIVCSVSISSNKTFIKNIKIDYAYYHQMIAHAELNPEFLKDAEVTQKFYNDEVDRWYFYYELKTFFGEDLEGETYAIYTTSQISKINIGDKIKVAVDSSEVTNLTDSVPIDFKNFSYKTDAEYMLTSNRLKNIKIAKGVLWGLEGVLVGGMILYMVKTKKREDQEKQVQQERAQEKHRLETEALKKDLDWRCEYCGNKNKASESKCLNCGAGKK